ncbi:MAG TPA: hypothetical protein VEY05_09045 [Beijerinckiaceae bacterium]|nr:hypothetical protein [Beijerinckiaceae bacterium]
MAAPRYGIERIDIARDGGAFELRIRTVEFHRDQIEHLLRSSGTRLNPPAAAHSGTNTAVTRSLLVFTAAALAGALAYSLFGRRDHARDRRRASRREAWPQARPSRWESRDDMLGERDGFASARREGLRSHAEGFAV